MAEAGAAVAAGVRAWLAELVPDPGPARKIVLLTFVQALGTGVFLSSSAIFLTTVVGIAPRLVGVGLSVAGLAGLLAAVPAGRVGDRVGPAVPLATTYAALAVLFLGYATVGGVRLVRRARLAHHSRRDRR